ncbi:MAG TPA: hypothetical protein VKW76_10835 [Candidatus Binatia bacterium]|nr:hypothetical protein [Candidatus Binatia bacterium]
MLAVLRCDAGPDVGHGHLGRCLALAEAAGERGVRCRFVGRFDAAAHTRIARAGAERVEASAATGSAEDAAATAACARGAALLVVDGYRFDASWLDRVAPARTGVPLLVVDDFARLPRHPDDAVVVNFGVRAAALAYAGERVTVLRGPRWFLARRALRATRRGRRPPAEPPRRVLLSIGGYDPHGLAARVARALAQHADLEVRIVCGTPPAGAEALAAAAPGRVRLEVGLDGLAESLAWADACVTGGGLTKYEAAYAGVPVAALAQTEDQALENAACAAHGLCVDLGFGPAVDDGALGRRLAGFLADPARRAALRAASRASFAADSTGAVLDAVLGRSRAAAGVGS